MNANSDSKTFSSDVKKSKSTSPLPKLTPMPQISEQLPIISDNSVKSPPPPPPLIRMFGNTEANKSGQDRKTVKRPVTRRSDPKNSSNNRSPPVTKASSSSKKSMATSKKIINAIFVNPNKSKTTRTRRIRSPKRHYDLGVAKRKSSAKMKFNFRIAKKCSKQSQEIEINELKTDEQRDSDGSKPIVGDTHNDSEIEDSGSKEVEDDCESHKSEESSVSNHFTSKLKRRKAATVALENVTKNFSKNPDVDKRLKKPLSKPLPGSRARSKRTILFKRKKKVRKGATTTAEIRAEPSVFYKGEYFQEGDVVGVKVDGTERYCIIRGFLVDPHNEISVSVIWLDAISNTEGFTPENFRAVPAWGEPLLSIDCVTFVAHCSLEYYFGQDVTLFSHRTPKKYNSYTWTRFGRQVYNYNVAEKVSKDLQSIKVKEESGILQPKSLSVPGIDEIKTKKMNTSIKQEPDADSSTGTRIAQTESDVSDG